MKKLLILFLTVFILTNFVEAQNPVTPQFKRKLPVDSLLGYSIPGVTGTLYIPDTAWVKKFATTIFSHRFKGNGTLSSPFDLSVGDTSATEFNNFAVFVNSNGALVTPNISFSPLTQTVLFNGIKVNANGGLIASLSNGLGNFFVKVDSTGNFTRDTSHYQTLLSFSSGITKTGTAVTLGGSLTGNALINVGSTHNFDVQSTGGGFTSDILNSGGIAGIQETVTSGNIANLSLGNDGTNPYVLFGSQKGGKATYIYSPNSNFGSGNGMYVSDQTGYNLKFRFFNASLLTGASVIYKAYLDSVIALRLNATTVSSPLVLSAGNVSMPRATTSVDGYLNHVDWTTFNGKQAALGFTPENVANKATNFTTLNNTLYPTTQAVANFALPLTFTSNNIVNLAGDSVVFKNTSVPSEPSFTVSPTDLVLKNSLSGKSTILRQSTAVTAITSVTAGQTGDLHVYGGAVSLSVSQSGYAAGIYMDSQLSSSFPEILVGDTSHVGIQTTFTDTSGFLPQSYVTKAYVLAHAGGSPDSTIYRTVANSYSLAGMQTKLNNYLLTTTAASTYQPLLSLTPKYIPYANTSSNLANSNIYNNGTATSFNTTINSGGTVTGTYQASHIFRGTAVSSTTLNMLGLDSLNRATWDIDNYGRMNLRTYDHTFSATLDLINGANGSVAPNDVLGHYAMGFADKNNNVNTMGYLLNTITDTTRTHVSASVAIGVTNAVNTYPSGAFAHAEPNVFWVFHPQNGLILPGLPIKDVTGTVTIDNTNMIFKNSGVGSGISLSPFNDGLWDYFNLTATTTNNGISIVTTPNGTAPYPYLFKWGIDNGSGAWQYSTGTNHYYVVDNSTSAGTPASLNFGVAANNVGGLSANNALTIQPGGKASSIVIGTGGATLITPALGVATATSINGNIFTTGTYTLTGSAGKTLTFSNTLTLAGTDGSTLNVGTGGTLGTNAYTSTAYAPIAGPTFTGTVTIPTPFTVGAVSMTSTGTQLNYLNAATGITGTGNVVFSAAPTFSGNINLGSGFHTGSGSFQETHVIGVTDMTTALFIGGGVASSSLSLKSTSGVGTTDFIRAIVGNNGATEAWRVFTSGRFGINTTTDDGTHQIQVNGTVSATGETISGLTASMGVGTDASKNLVSVNYALTLPIVGTPTIVAGAGAGTGPTVSVTSNGKQLQVTVTTGTLPTGTNATVATVTLANALTYTPNPVFSAASAATALLNGASMIYMTSTGTANVTITSGTTGLTAATTYVWNISL